MQDSSTAALHQQVAQIERILSQVTEVQARQIDRERSVPGSDPAQPANKP